MNPFQPGRELPPGRNAKAATRFGKKSASKSKKKAPPPPKKGKGKKKYPPLPGNPLLAAMAAAGRG